MIFLFFIFLSFDFLGFRCVFLCLHHGRQTRQRISGLIFNFFINMNFYGQFWIWMGGLPMVWFLIIFIVLKYFFIKFIKLIQFLDNSFWCLCFIGTMESMLSMWFLYIYIYINFQYSILSLCTIKNYSDCQSIWKKHSKVGWIFKKHKQKLD